MAKIPLYNGNGAPPKFTSEMHAGLWYDKFFNQYSDSWEVINPDKRTNEPGGKVNWVNTVTGMVGDNNLIGEHARRIKKLVEEGLSGEVCNFKSQWNFVTGLGLSHPVENGFAWHRNLGVPYLTGAAVKGMLSAWVNAWEKYDKAVIKQWFGEQDKKKEPCAGELIFLDAVPSKPVELVRDVMTPHMGDWYEKGGEKPDTLNGTNIPADWHDPNPIPFLAVAPGQQFQFAFAKRPGSEVDLKAVRKALIEALSWIGAGAKTAAGYGRFEGQDGP